jgi:hypothetical protein
MGDTSGSLAGLCAPFWVHLEVPKCPKTVEKNYFLVVPDHFFYKNGLIYLVRGLFSSLNIGTYILPTCGLLSTVLGPFGGVQKTNFLVGPDHLFFKNGLNDMVRGQKQHRKTTFGLFCTISPKRTGLIIKFGAYFQA